jgi:hypothetical protein
MAVGATSPVPPGLTVQRVGHGVRYQPLLSRSRFGSVVWEGISEPRATCPTRSVAGDCRDVSRRTDWMCGVRARRRGHAVAHELWVDANAP